MLSLNVNISPTPSSQILAPNKLRNAINRSISKTSTHLKTFTAAHLRQTYYLKAGDISKAIRVSHSKSNSQLIIRGKRLGIQHFKISPKPPNKRRKPIIAQVRRDTSPYTVKGGFFMPKLGAKSPVFRRVGNDRLPLEPVLRLAIPQMVSSNPELLEQLSEQARDTLSRNLKHEISYMLGGR